MSENLTKGNRQLEARIRQCASALDIATLCHEMPVTELIRENCAPETQHEGPIGTKLQKLVPTDDGREILITADSFYGLDTQEDAIRRGLWK